MGMQAHELIMGEGNTFQLPVPDTTPYNADFDGDEMNLHVMQNPLATSEAKEIMSVPMNIISPKDSKPVISLVQDSVIGTYMLTSKDMFLTRSRFFDLSMSVHYGEKPIPTPAIMYKKIVCTDKAHAHQRSCYVWGRLYTGKQLVSFCTPKGINMQRSTRNLDDTGPDACLDLDERRIIIHDGNVISGQICQQIIGGVSRGVIDRICKQQSNWKAAKFISDLQRVATNWLNTHGFSIGISDCAHPVETQEKIDQIIQGTYKRVKEGVAKARANQFTEKEIEGEVQNIFSNVLNSVANSVLSTIPTDNRIRMSVESGSKGKKLNICQIHGCIGQQIVSGGRTRHRKDFSARTFPCFEKGDEDPRAFGFCPTNYLQGLDPVTYYTHSMGGREGMIDTACKTAETGYIQRRLITILQSEKAHFDQTVRDANNGIVMFKYGGDCMDPVKLMKVRTKILTLSGSPRDVAIRWCGGEGVEAERLAPVVDLARKAGNVFGKDIDYIHLPFDLYDFFSTAFNAPCPLPEDILQLVIDAENEIIRIIGDELSCNHILVHIRSTIVSKRLSGVTVEDVKSMLDLAVEKTLCAVITGGEMVGTLAAQSIGEPATQMTLNTFHSAGTGNRTVLRGVPRFKEIIDVSKNPKAPSCTVYMNSDIASSKTLTERIAKGMKRVLLSEVVLSKRILLDPNDNAVEEDDDIVRRYGVVCEQKNTLPWVCRLHLDRRKIQNLSLCMKDITRAIRTFTDDKAIVISSENDESECIVRIRPLRINSLKKCMNQTESDDERQRLEEIIATDMVDMVVESCRISGLDAIRNTFTVCKNKKYHIETEGNDFQEILASGSVVDPTRTQSTNLQDNLYILGVSAAVTVLFREAHDVLTEAGTYISPRHLELLALKMSYSGVPIPVTRHGMAKAKHSVLLRASFERTVDTFMEGAMHSVSDTCHGIVESIVMGQVPKMGSGFIDVISTSLPRKKRQLPVEEEEFIGRRKRANTKKNRWDEPVLYQHSWDFSMDPARSFNLFKIKYKCNTREEEVFSPPPNIWEEQFSSAYVPTSPAYDPNAPPGTYAPTSPAYDPNAPPGTYRPISPAYNPNAPPQTPPFFCPVTPPFMVRNDETPPTTPPEPGLSPEFSTTPTWNNGPDTPKEPDLVKTPQESKSDAEWVVNMTSPHINHEDGLMPWVVHPQSPTIIDK